MNREHPIVQSIANATGFTRTDVAYIITAFVKTSTELLLREERVELEGLGTLKVRRTEKKSFYFGKKKVRTEYGPPALSIEPSAYFKKQMKLEKSPSEENL